MKHIRCALSWMFYGIGHVAYLAIDRCAWSNEQEEPGRAWKFGYDVYQWGMATSSRIDKYGCVWSTPQAR